MSCRPALAALALGLGLSACASDVVIDPHLGPTALKAGELEAYGIAIITPSTITGQEQEKQAVALVFADVLAREKPKVRVTPLAETLNAMNRADLSDAYQGMFEDYRSTGLFRVEALKQVAAATGARYIGQLQLQKFNQLSKSRMNIIGFRVF